MATQAGVGRFTTEWDTSPNPTYDIWTSVNGSEVVPGVVSPLVATTFNERDHRGLEKLMATYPGGDAVTLVEPPGSNFWGVFGGRLALNNGFSVAAVSVLNAEIAQAILQQFFTGATGGERFIADVDPQTRAEAAATAAAQREAAPAMLAGWRAALYAERRTNRFARDLQLDLVPALDRWNDLWAENTESYLNLHYVVSVAAAESQVMLAGLLAAGGGDPNVVVALCSGLGDVESSKPATALYRIAEMVRDDPALRGRFATGDVETLIAAVHGAGALGPEWQPVRDAFAAFLFEYGYRGQGEVDPTNADWAEEPRFVVSQIKAMVAIPPDQSPAAGIAAAIAAREQLERATRAALPAELQSPFDAALAAAQHFTRLRELSKATWVLASRRLRAPYLAIARGLAQRGVVSDPDDARFVTARELGQIAAGDIPADIAERVERRRAQATEAAAHRLPDNWTGEPEPIPVSAAPRDATSLQGLGVSIGRGPVTGTARIVPSAESGLARELEPGDILVAPFTDAPWTPLFLVAGAVVVETGGVLSHAATVAREFGIPAVVMVADATRVIRDGDTVTVDGAAGTVTIAERTPPT